ncbi:MAG: hypothetical protein M5U34_15075 [Chloroflexi bacterium]|nr:hypothetical protein [Chloroflexota bacterium]
MGGDAFYFALFWLALNSLVWDSPTMDEQNHLARGLAFCTPAIHASAWSIRRW